MSIVARIAGALSCAAVISASGCGAGTGSVTAEPPASFSAAMAGQAAPHYMLPRGAAAPNVVPDTFLTYGGGPVLVAPKMYVILWGYKKAGDPDHVATLLQAYAQSIGGSDYNNIVTQYYQMPGKKKVAIKNPSNQFGGVWDDETPIPKSPDDGQVAAEALRGVAHFGYDPNGSYFVATAHGHASQGFYKQFCAYHSSVTSGKDVVPYINFPYTPDGGKSCGVNFIKPPSDEGGKVEGVTIVAGHELAESVTDPDPYDGWNSVEGEIADMCQWVGIQNDPFGKSSWTSQPLFSDKTQTCVHSYP
jgi:serine protease